MTKSIWQSYGLPYSNSLNHDIQTDVCIIGTGIAGLTTGYLLALAGESVCILGDRAIGSGETSLTTAQINTTHDDMWSEMEHIHGVEKMMLCAESYRDAVKTIANIVTAEQIECGFEYVPGYLFSHDRGPRGMKWLTEEFAAAERAGVQQIELISQVPGKKLSLGPAILYKNQAQFHPRAYLNGLFEGMKRSGKAKIYVPEHAEEVHEDAERVSVVTASGHTITASRLVVATNVPIHTRFIPHEALAAYRSYVAVYEVNKDIIPRGQYWDTADPYHYVRLAGAARPWIDGDKETELLIVGGEDRRVGEDSDPKEPFEKLSAWTQSHFGISSPIVAKWSGQIIETFDGMPLIGAMQEEPSRTYIITGDSGMGMIHGTIGGIIIRDLIMDGKSEWQELYTPLRSRAKALGRWAKQNIKTITQYTDWVTSGEVNSVDDIAPGTGAILRDGLKKIAAYKTCNGELRCFSAVCPHLGGMVRWNPLENSFDCPVHGSRFDTEGNVLNGPSSGPLTREE